MCFESHIYTISRGLSNGACKTLFIYWFILPAAGGVVFPSSLQVLNLRSNRLSLNPEGEILQIIHHLSRPFNYVTVWSISQLIFSMDML